MISSSTSPPMKASVRRRAGESLIAIAVFASGCAHAPQPQVIDAVPATASVNDPTTPIAFWRGRAIRRSDLESALVERAGAVTLREYLLDRRLAELALAAGIAIDASRLAAERAILVENFSADPDLAERLLEAVRARQGLGEQRFEALLRRNATLRALVTDQVVVDEDTIARIHDVVHGPERVARIIAAAELADASALAERAAAGEEFAALAFAHSSDPSRGAGGLLPPVSRLDPAWPAAFREALFALEVGEVSPPVLADDSWVVITLLETRPGDDVAIESVRPELERIARRQLERVRMDLLLREVAESLAPDIVDPTYRRGWESLAETP